MCNPLDWNLHFLSDDDDDDDNDDNNLVTVFLVLGFLVKIFLDFFEKIFQYYYLRI